MYKSDSIKELAAALSKAQAKMGKAVKSSENPFFRSKYADLTSVWDACIGTLTEYGLSVTQLATTTPDGQVGVESVLLHNSGEFISGTIYLKPVKQDPQAAGSAISYARRYALSALVGVMQEDDDANHATHQSNHRPQESTSVPLEVKTNKQVAAVHQPVAGSEAKPPKGELYTGTSDQQQTFKEFLKGKKIPEDKWLAIHEKMLGKPKKDITHVLKEL